MIEKIKQYFQDIKSELGKVAWPSREELIGSTNVVIVISLIFAVYIFSVDWLLNQGLGIILNLNK